MWGLQIHQIWAGEQIELDAQHYVTAILNKKLAPIYFTPEDVYSPQNVWSRPSTEMTIELDGKIISTLEYAGIDEEFHTIFILGASMLFS